MPSPLSRASAMNTVADVGTSDLSYVTAPACFASDAGWNLSWTTTKGCGGAATAGVAIAIEAPIATAAVTAFTRDIVDPSSVGVPAPRLDSRIPPFNAFSRLSAPFSPR
ncbi:hypothetical protein GCM10009575_035470 [Streptomyces rhizosphaericus]|uniref:Uncharacterized protein n=1 Tax=Streptomyces rhizosphaericus TaxID=114699 RepID=A0ABN1PNV8_9ACTN